MLQKPSRKPQCHQKNKNLLFKWHKEKLSLIRLPCKWLRLVVPRIVLALCCLLPLWWPGITSRHLWLWALMVVSEGDGERFSHWCARATVATTMEWRQQQQQWQRHTGGTATLGKSIHKRGNSKRAPYSPPQAPPSESIYNSYKINGKSKL